MSWRNVAPFDVGTELLPLVLSPIQRATLQQYADASGDHNPLHLDTAAAQAAGEPDVIAHGMLSMAYAGRLVSTRLSGWEMANWRLRFTAKTPLGARVACRGHIVEVEPNAVIVEISVELDDGTVTAAGQARCIPATERKTA